MKTEDIFEALTDIDDKFIAAARPNEFDDVDITVAHPAPKKPVWKTLVPIAASLAVLGAAGAFGARYLREHPIPNSSNNASTASSEPERTPVSTAISTYEPAYTALKPGDGEDPIITDNISGPLVIGDLSGLDGLALAEFPDRSFTIKGNTILMRKVGSEDTMKRAVISGDELYFADLNGDGLRELCARSSLIGGIDYGHIEVYDIENDERYTYETGTDTVLNLSVLGDSILVTNVNDKQPNTFRLTLDVLRKLDKPDYVEVPFDVTQTFTLPDFEGFTFCVDILEFEQRQFRFAGENGSVGGEGGVDSVYFCDLDGDGTREIIINGPFIGVSGVKVYGFMDDGEIGLVSYIEDDGIRLAGRDGKLVCLSDSGEEKPFEFQKSDLKPISAAAYSVEPVTWNHTVDCSDIFPWCDKYTITVNNRYLKINGGDVGSYNSGAEIQDLYFVPDWKNYQLLIAYTDAEHDRVVVVKLTEDGINSTYLRKDIALKPTQNKLMLADPESGELVMSLPGQYQYLT